MSLIKPVLAVDLGSNYGFGNVASLGDFISSLTTPAFSIASALVIFYFLFGAFKWLSSGGEKEELAKAQQMITHAIIGLIMLMFLFALVKFMPEFLGIGVSIIK